MLVHVCAHGARWNEMPLVRWVVDAALLVRSGAVDWTHVLAQTERLGLSLPLYETLKYLRTTMRVPIPETVIKNLARSRVKSIERLLYEAEFHPSHQWSMISTLRIHRHIARHEVLCSNGPIGYRRYFVALCRGRSLRELGLWTRQRLGLWAQLGAFTSGSSRAADDNVTSYISGLADNSRCAPVHQTYKNVPRDAWFTLGGEIKNVLGKGTWRAAG
jgi:hypothetical protein